MPFDINDPDTAAALKKAIDDARAEEKEAAAALQANNKKLLDQLREAKKSLEIDPAKHAALEDQVETLTAQLNERDKAYKKLEKDSTAAAAALTKQYEEEHGFTKTLLVDNGLSDALVKAGVEPQFMPAVKAMLKAQVAVVADANGRRALVGDKPLADFVAAWATGDEGKHFVKAQANSGGSAGGGAGSGAAVTFIAANDKVAIGANLAELAKGSAGTVQVA